MKVKKYPQSCLMFDVNGTKILVDPSNLKYQDSYFSEWGAADAILVTHRHTDHFKADTISKFNIPIYTTNEVANFYKKGVNPASKTKEAQTWPMLPFSIVKEGKKFKVNEVKVEVTNAIHGFNPAMKETKNEIFENIGFIIDDGNTRAYVTSDTICFNHDYKADYVFAPATGNCVTMDPIGVAAFTKDVGAKKLFVIHTDSYTLTPAMEETIQNSGVVFEVMQTGKEYDI